MSAYRHMWRGDKRVSAAAENLMTALAEDPMARLKWRVMGLLGVDPASLRALLLTRRRTLALACHLALDAGAGADTVTENPQFDMARFRALAGRH